MNCRLLISFEVKTFKRSHDGMIETTCCFDLLAEGGPVFLVHLTWSVESDPKWPWTEVYERLDDFLKRWPREELQGDPDEDAIKALKRMVGRKRPPTA